MDVLLVGGGEALTPPAGWAVTPSPPGLGEKEVRAPGVRDSAATFRSPQVVCATAGTDLRCPLDLTVAAGSGARGQAGPRAHFPVSAESRAQAVLSGQMQLYFGSLVPIAACLSRGSRIYLLRTSELQQWRTSEYRGPVLDFEMTFAECSLH